MNESHLAWCKQHDWGKDAWLENGAICIDDCKSGMQFTFLHFSNLVKWAGY